jgi:hypothetical protein
MEEEDGLRTRVYGPCTTFDAPVELAACVLQNRFCHSNPVGGFANTYRIEIFP